VRKFVIGREYEGVFLKPKYGDASGVRGACKIGKKRDILIKNFSLEFNS
jgi:fructokinase